MKNILRIPILAVALVACNGAKNNSSNQNDSVQNISAPNKTIIASPTHYVLQGDTFRAEVIPFDSTQLKNSITVEGLDSNAHAKWENGVLNVSIPANDFGLSHLNGSLKMQMPNGTKKIPFSADYVVAALGGAVTSNILLKDFENKIYVSAGGIAPGDLSVTCSDAALKSAGIGVYTISPHKTGKLTIALFWNREGKKINIHNYDFDVYEKK